MNTNKYTVKTISSVKIIETAFKMFEGIFLSKFLTESKLVDFLFIKPADNIFISRRYGCLCCSYYFCCLYNRTSLQFSIKSLRSSVMPEIKISQKCSCISSCVKLSVNKGCRASLLLLIYSLVKVLASECTHFVRTFIIQQKLPIVYVLCYM